jgi:hypothetical protein
LLKYILLPQTRVKVFFETYRQKEKNHAQSQIFYERTGESPTLKKGDLGRFDTISQSIGGRGVSPVQAQGKASATINCFLIATRYENLHGGKN